MAENTASPAPKKGAAFWVGWVLGVLSVGPMLLSGIVKIAHLPPAVQGFTTQFGYPLAMLTVVGILEVGSAIIYLIPQTATLGAILVAGFLGGAVATHVRIQDPTGFAPFVMGVLAWLGLWLRDPRLRQLLPIRRP